MMLTKEFHHQCDPRPAAAIAQAGRDRGAVVRALHGARAMKGDHYNPLSDPEVVAEQRMSRLDRARREDATERRKDKLN